MSGSHQGVIFDLAGALAGRYINALGVTAPRPAVVGFASSSSHASQGSPTSAASPSPSLPASPTPQQKSRSSVLAAVSHEPRDIAQAMAATRGWSGAQWTCLDKLWLHESRFQTTVRNKTSGAYGIPQALPGSKMASAGDDWRTNPVTQIEWGLTYISARYGTPCGAWNHWLRHNSY